MKRLAILLFVLMVALCGCSVPEETAVPAEETEIEYEYETEDEEDSSVAEILLEEEETIEEEVVIENEEPEASEENVSVTVYRTKTGEKYHRSGCRHLKSKIETTVDEAKARGLKPCSVCNPPN